MLDLLRPHGCVDLRWPLFKMPVLNRNLCWPLEHLKTKLTVLEMSMCVSHPNRALPTLLPCAPNVAGYVCDGRCNLRHPSGAELAAMKASHGARPRGAEKSASSGSICSPVEGGKGESSSSATSSAPVCKFFVKSRCTKGSSCIFSHATPHQKEQPAWDKSATATVAPRPERKVAALTLRAAAAKARAADTSETSVAASSDAKIGVDEHDGASSETGTVRTDVKDKAVEILERHRWDEVGYCS